MQKSYINPSDARSWVLCKRRAWYDNFPPNSCDIVPLSEFDKLLITFGKEHEKEVKKILEEGKSLIQAESPEHTQALIASGVDVIYQPIIEDKERNIIAKPDFLIRNENGKYQAADAKLAQSMDNDAIKIQIGIYRVLLNNSLPAIVFLGDKTTAKIGDEANDKIEDFISDMGLILLRDSPPEVRYGESKCNACPYFNLCKPKFVAKEEITLLYGIDSRSAPDLEKQGITTITKLSLADPNNITDVPHLKGFENKRRAVLQAQAYFSNDFYLIVPFTLPQGTYVHFDIEDNPFTQSNRKHVYLWGFLGPTYDEASFEYVWTDHEDQDKAGWLRFLELAEKYRKKYSNLVLAHFSSHEKSTIKGYAEFYNMLENPTVDWLLGKNSPLFNIQKPIKDSFVLPLGGYGLKQICKHKNLVNFQWKNENSEAQWSVVQFNRYLGEANNQVRESIKKEILSYNFDDVMGTRKLEEWLRSFI